jgi:hypothetical protein
MDPMPWLEAAGGSTRNLLIRRRFPTSNLALRSRLRWTPRVPRVRLRLDGLLSPLLSLGPLPGCRRWMIVLHVLSGLRASWEWDRDLLSGRRRSLDRGDVLPHGPRWRRAVSPLILGAETDECRFKGNGRCELVTYVLVINKALRGDGAACPSRMIWRESRSGCAMYVRDREAS